jgi:hypothetical protein
MRRSARKGWRETRRGGRLFAMMDVVASKGHADVFCGADLSQVAAEKPKD